MKRISLCCALLLSGTALALTTQPFKDNTDITVLLSDANYNRLVVRDDKITKAHFPEGSMAIKNEEDGSLYVLVAQKEPFTLFLTTESGHHFSTTVNVEASLGKTIEFVSTSGAVAKAKTPASTPPIKPQQPPMANAISRLMTQMIKAEKVKGFELKHHYGRVIRLQQGLVLTPKITYTGITLNGEVTEIYNGGKTALDLTETLFMSEDVKAVSLSQTTLGPKQKAIVYRVLERIHG